MNNRQKRLCRALLDFYDASGAQPYPLAQLAKKSGYHISDIYDKDSQSGDLWPFDPRARGNYAGMLSFAPGKNPTVSITPTGLVALENLCKDEPSREDPAKVVVEKAKDTPKPAAVVQEKPLESPKTAASPAPSPAPAKKFPSSSKRFSADDIADARARFKFWLKSEEGRKTLVYRLDGDELIEGAFDKFFGEFLENKEA